jgi:hypothetical protein
LDAKQLKGGLFIDLQASTRAAEKCQVSKYYSSAGVRGDKNDLRWCLDMNELYPNAGHLTIRQELLWGKIHISSGQWYASNLSEFKWRMVSADPAKPAAALNFDRQVAWPTAQIEMNRGDVLTIKGDDIDLSLNADNGYGYELSFSNLPPSEMVNIDHWLYYYDILEENLSKMVPVLASRASFNPPGRLCSSLVLSDSTLSTP